MNVLARIVAFRWQPGMVIDHQDVFECIRNMTAHPSDAYYGDTSHGILFSPDIWSGEEQYFKWGVDPAVPEPVIMVKKPFVSMQFSAVMSDSQDPDDYATYDIHEMGIEDLLGEFREPLERIYDWVLKNRKGRSKNDARAFVVGWAVTFTDSGYDFDEDWRLLGLVDMNQLAVYYEGEQ